RRLSSHAYNNANVRSQKANGFTKVNVASYFQRLNYSWLRRGNSEYWISYRVKRRVSEGPYEQYVTERTRKRNEEKEAKTKLFWVVWLSD
ncbi:hypothetical protein J3L16_16050, partial [Alteromonas sp. 5E99-2]|uniref:hypothetical protein n=1 Tax=Alteromonas sp. 5E99-2 TaxID=2817683 RepID=UPI001A98B057